MVIGTLFYLLLTATVAFVYSRYIHDLLMLTLAAFSLIVVITWIVGYELNRNDFHTSSLLVIGLVIIGQAALAVNWLQRTARSWEATHG